MDQHLPQTRERQGKNESGEGSSEELTQYVLTDKWKIFLIAIKSKECFKKQI
jgi:hypothetical protein